MKMRIAMRPLALAMASLFLTTHVGAEQEVPGRPQPMTSAEDARLAARAAQTPQLEKFTAGQDGEACLYLIFFVALVAFSVAVGQVIALPLGVVHSTQGRGFVPADCLKGESKTVNYFNACGVIGGFHLYVVGYLFGLAVRPELQPPAKPAPPEKPAPPDGRDLERYFLGTLVEVEGLLQITGVSDAADRAGLQKGDLVLDIDDEAVNSVNLTTVLSRHSRQDAVQVGILRQGSRLQMTIVSND